MDCPVTILMMMLFVVSCVDKTRVNAGTNTLAVVMNRSKSNRRVTSTITNKKPLGNWNGDIQVVVSDDNNSVATLDNVCEKFKDGGFALFDMTAPAVGPLIRSFARTLGMAYFTMVDKSTLLPVDFSHIHLGIEPPGSAMFHIIPDIVRREKFTKVAILYDESFDLHVIPKRILTGVPAQHLYQEIHTDEDVLVKQLTRLKNLEIKIFFVIAGAVSVTPLLGAANGLGLFADKYNWFILTKGSKLSCHKCRNSSIIMISGEPDYNLMIQYLDEMNKMSNIMGRDDMKVDEVFLYDFQYMLGEALSLANPTFSVPVQDCYGIRNSSLDLYRQSERFVEAFRNITRKGVYGDIMYSEGMLRQKIRLSLKRQTIQSGTITSAKTVGSWTEESGLKVNDNKSLIEIHTKKEYRVVIYPRYPPFVYKSTNGSNPPYYGYCIDLLDRIKTIVGFEYTLYESPDKLAGAMADDGTWNGVINELIQKNADIAVGPISVMAERENFVDFTVPYYDLVGLTILMKKPKFVYSLFRFLDVLDLEVWGGIIAAFFLFSGLLCVFDKLSPYSYQNNLKLWNGTGAEPRVFTFKEGVWFCMMSLTPQGGGEAPRALSGRLIAATWWLFGFLIIATYTANLAAFLTVSRLETPIKSLDDLSAQYKVNYGPQNGSAAMVYFKRMAEIEERFYSIWKQMSLNDSLDAVQRAKLAVWDYPVSNKYTKLWETMHTSGFPNTLDEAIDNVLDKDFAYIGDAAENKYQTYTNCELEEVGEEFSRKPFAFAVQDGSPLRSELSNAILQLLNERFLETLKAKWWNLNDEKIDCPKIEDESNGISIKNIGGVFLVIALGTALALVCLAFEFYLYRYKPKQDSKRYGVAKTQSKADLRLNGTVSKSTNGSATAATDENNQWPDVTLDLYSNGVGSSQNGHSNFALDFTEKL